MTLLTGNWIELSKNIRKNKSINIRLHFMRHYAEPSLDIEHFLSLDGEPHNQVVCNEFQCDSVLSI